MLSAAERCRIPLYAETHRATIFQNYWRTVQCAKRSPELHDNGDFSNWYTGSEFVDGRIFRLPCGFRCVLFKHCEADIPACVVVKRLVLPATKRHSPRKYTGAIARSAAPSWTVSTMSACLGYLRIHLSAKNSRTGT